MKIGLLTYFWSENPGTFLQALSTYTVLENLFPNDKIEMVNVRSREVNFRPAKRNLLSPCRIYKSYKRHKSYKKGLEKMKFSAEEYIGVDSKDALHYISKQEYDMIIVGSDTIYKLNEWHIKDETLPVYFLEGIVTKKAMAASSCGSTSIKEFSTKMRQSAKMALKDFSKLGVRDKNTYELFRNLKEDGSNITLVPDPTFTYDISLEAGKSILHKNKYNFEKKSVIINLPKDFTALKAIIDYFKHEGWQIITFEYNKYADHSLFVNPEEWASIPHFVDLVVTDRFHGSLFSLRNNTPVIGVDCNEDRVSADGFSKVSRLFEEYEIVDYYVNFVRDQSVDNLLRVISDAINLEVDFTDKNKELRKRYIDFIHSIKSEFGDNQK